MPRYDFNIVGDYNILRSLEYDSQDTVNLYIVTDNTAKKPNSLQPMPGRSHFADYVADQTTRINGLYRVRDFAYAVSGQSVYKFNSTTSLQSIGNVTTANSPISWANSPTELAIVDGANLYSYNISTGVFQTITAITGAGFPPNPQMIYYQDARFVLSFADSAQYFYSNFATAATGALEQWDAQNVFVQQSRPSLSVGITGSNERLFLFGDVSVEVWAPYTTPNLLPFYRDNNFIFEFGCAAKESIVKGVLDVADGQGVSSFVYWLTTNNSGSGCFVVTMGGTPVKVSNQAIDLRLNEMTVISDCVSTLYKEGGHIFIENTFPTENVTYVLDLNTWKWFRKERLNHDASHINSHVYLGNTHFVGSSQDSGLYLLSDQYLADGDQSMRRSRSTLTFTDPSYKRICGNMFEVDFEAGNVPQGIDPTAYLSISFDGGKTYGNPRPTNMGKIGKYRWKAQWYGLGTDYNFTFKIDVYDEVRVFILGGAFDYEVLRE